MPAGAGLEPAGGGRVQVRSFRAKQRLIGHLADQDVAEGEAVSGRGPDEILLDESIQQRVGVGGQIRSEGGDSIGAEGPPEHRAELQDSPLLRLQEVESGQDGRLDRVGERRERMLNRRDIAQGGDAFPDRLDDFPREEGVASARTTTRSTICGALEPTR